MSSWGVSNRVNRLDGLQALRAIAALAVTAFHVSHYAVAGLPDAPRLPHLVGEAAVWLFFAISGFIMLRTLDAHPERSWQRFGAERVVRIVPLYWMMTAVAAASVALGARLLPTRELDVGTVVRSLLFIPVANPDGAIQPLWSVGWTLVFEMAFYAVVTFARGVRTDPLVVSAPVICVAAALTLVRPDSGSPWWVFADPIVLWFLGGMVIARFDRMRAGAALGVLAVAFGLLRAGSTDNLGVLDAVWFLVLTAVLAAVVRFDRILGMVVPGWLRHIGAASYALYLTHPLFGALTAILVARVVPSPWTWSVGATLGTLVAVIAGSVTHRWIEVPLTRTLRRRVAASFPEHRPVGDARASA